MKPFADVALPGSPNGAGYQAPAVGKAFALLNCVAAAPAELGLSRLARELGFSKSTTSGLIQALLNSGALDRSNGGRTFVLGPAIRALAAGNLDTRQTRKLAQSHLDSLRDRIGETVFLGGLDRRRATIIATAEAAKPVKITARPGTVLPLLAGAVGKIYLARHDDARARDLLRQHGLKRHTPSTITDETLYLAELARVRARRYALDRQEYLSGVEAVAIDLGRCRGLSLALWVVGFSGFLSDGAVSGVVADMFAAAAKINKALTQI